MAQQKKPQAKKKKKGRIRWGRVILLFVPLLVIFAGVWGISNLLSPLKLKAQNYVVEYGTLFQPLDNVKSLFFDSTENIKTKGTVDSVKTEGQENSKEYSKIGTYDYAYEYKGKEYPFTVTVKDTQGPVIKLKDYTTDTLETVKAESFIDSITDASNYTIKMDNREDTKEPGTFSVVFTAKDQYGNESSASCRLIRKQDKQAPSLDNFTKQVQIMQGTAFNAETCKAVDDLDPSATVEVDTSKLDVNVPGKYKVNYTVRDRSGNEETYVQDVTVKEDPDFGKQIVYLTFDDGPSQNTGKILDILDRYGVKATFFVTGNQPQWNKYMKEAVDRGNTVGLHTFGHKYDQLYASEEAYFQDLEQISNLVEQETGVKSDVIRFPGGSSNSISANYSPGIMDKLVNDVQEKGYQYFDWNADSTDASGNNVPVEQIVTNATSAIGMDQVNILFHDTDAKSTTVEALPAVIEAYQNAGYVFRPLTKDSFAPHHNVNN